MEVPSNYLTRNMYDYKLAVQLEIIIYNTTSRN